MDSLAPALATVLEHHNEPARLMADLLDGLVRMLRTGHEPSPYLLLSQGVKLRPKKPKGDTD